MGYINYSRKLFKVFISPTVWRVEAMEIMKCMKIMLTTEIMRNVEIICEIWRLDTIEIRGYGCFPIDEFLYCFL